MRHSYFGRKLKRTANERSRLFKNLVRDLVIHGQIKTTLAKAKAVQPMAEKAVTKAKKADNASLNVLRTILTDRISVNKLIKDAKDRFSNRTSGFTRIIKLGKRLGDNAEEVLLSFVDPEVKKADKTEKTEKNKVKKAATKTQVKEVKRGQPKKKI